MKKLNLSEATAPVTDYIEMSDRKPLIIKVDEQPQAALMSFMLADELTQSFNSNPEFINLVQAAKAGRHIESNGGDFRIEPINPGRSLAEYAEQIDDRPLIVTVDGKPIAVLIPIGNADMETASLSLNPRFVEMLEESRRRLKTEGGISLEQLTQDLSEVV